MWGMWWISLGLCAGAAGGFGVIGQYLWSFLALLTFILIAGVGLNELDRGVNGGHF